jgi:DNA replication protein DnaC
MEALARGYLVRYTTLDDLVRGLRQADALGKLNNKLAPLQRPHLLVIDEAGYLQLDRADANRIFGVVNRRYTRGSTIITSNETVGEWADTFCDEALAAAISTACSTTPKCSRSTARATASRADSTPCDHSPSTSPTPPDQNGRPTTSDVDQPTFFDGA